MEDPFTDNLSNSAFGVPRVSNVFNMQEDENNLKLNPLSLPTTGPLGLGLSHQTLPNLGGGFVDPHFKLPSTYNLENPLGAGPGDSIQEVFTRRCLYPSTSFLEDYNGVKAENNSGSEVVLDISEQENSPGNNVNEAVQLIEPMELKKETSIEIPVKKEADFFGHIMGHPTAEGAPVVLGESPSHKITPANEILVSNTPDAFLEAALKASQGVRPVSGQEGISPAHRSPNGSPGSPDTGLMREQSGGPSLLSVFLEGAQACTNPEIVANFVSEGVDVDEHCVEDRITEAVEVLPIAETPLLEERKPVDEKKVIETVDEGVEVPEHSKKSKKQCCTIM